MKKKPIILLVTLLLISINVISQNKASIYGKAWLGTNASYGDVVIVTNKEMSICYGSVTTKATGDKYCGTHEITGLPANKPLLVTDYHLLPNYMAQKKIRLINGENKKVILSMDINYNDYGSMEFFLALPLLANDVYDRKTKNQILQDKVKKFT